MKFLGYEYPINIVTRKCRNWQTSKTKDLVAIAVVWVQVPSSAFCGCSSMVEHQPSKLDTWVRFPSPAFLIPFFGKQEETIEIRCLLMEKVGGILGREMRMKKSERIKKALEMELREHRSSFIVYMVLRALVIICMVLQILNRNYENVFLCILTLFLLVVPSLIQLQLKIELPTTLEIIILLFIFAAEILGEIQEYYIKIANWDMILHTLNGFLMAAIGFSLVDILNREEKLKFELSPAFMSVVAFSFSMTVGVLWEFFEYTMDSFFGFDMQKDTIIHTISSVMLDPNGGNVPTTIKGITDVAVNGQSLGLGGYLDIGLHDTMEDLFVNFIGAVIFAIIGYFYMKKKGQGKVAARFIPTLKKKERDFLKIVEESELDKEQVKKEETKKEQKSE